jgi:hypothetical protein
MLLSPKKQTNKPVASCPLDPELLLLEVGRKNLEWKLGNFIRIISSNPLSAMSRRFL